MDTKMVLNGNELIVWLRGEIDHHSAKKIREATDSLIQQCQPLKLRLNFSGVTFMDSSAIGLIMGRYRIMQLYGGKLRVTDIPPGLRRIMELSGLGALNIFEGESEAYESA